MVAWQFPFDGQVVLIGILRPQHFGKFAEQQNGTEAGPINGRAARRIQNSVEGVGIGAARLIQEGRLRLQCRIDDEITPRQRGVRR